MATAGVARMAVNGAFDYGEKSCHACAKDISAGATSRSAHFVGRNQPHLRGRFEPGIGAARVGKRELRLSRYILLCHSLAKLHNIRGTKNFRTETGSDRRQGA